MRKDPAAGDLSLEECWGLLRRSSLGRLALSARALPVILPVQHRVDGGTIVMCLGSEPPFDPVVDDVVAAFAVESIDPGTSTGWTVHVQGMLTGVSRLDGTDRCPVGAGLVIGMEPVVVTGWRLQLCPLNAADHWPLPTEA